MILVGHIYDYKALCSQLGRSNLRLVFILLRKGLPMVALYMLCVKTYVFHMLGTYVTILCNWLILQQNTLYLYLGRSRMCLILQETLFQIQMLKSWKSVQDSSVKSAIQ